MIDDDEFLKILSKCITSQTNVFKHCRFSYSGLTMYGQGREHGHLTGLMEAKEQYLKWKKARVDF